MSTQSAEPESNPAVPVVDPDETAQPAAEPDQGQDDGDESDGDGE